MVRANKLFFYIPLLLIVIGLYRNSWLPGGHLIQGKETILIFLISSFYLILIFDINRILNLSIRFFIGYNKYIVLLFILFLISTIFYNIQEISNFKFLIRLLDYVFFFIIFFLIVPKILELNITIFKLFLKIVSNTGFITAIFGIFLLFVGINPAPQFEGSLVSFIEQPNYVPFIFNYGIFTTIFFLDWQKEEINTFKKYFYIASIILQSFALLLTLSRGAYIGLAIGILVYFFVKYRFKILLLAPVLLTVLLLIVPPFFRAKGFSSFMSRFYLLIPAYIMIMNNKIGFLWGYGATGALDTFVSYNLIYNLTGSIRESQLNNPHNAIVSLILMFGTLFTVAMIIFIGVLLFNTILRALKEKNNKISIFLGYLVSIILSLIFQSLFDSEITMPEFFSLQMILIFLGLAYRITINKNISSLLRYFS